MSDIEKHPQIEQILQDLVDGVSVRDVERKYGVSKSAAGRLLQRGLPAHLVKARGAREAVSASGLLERLAALGRQTEEVLAIARGAGESGTALKAIGRLEKQLELQGRLAGQLATAAVNVSVNLHESPEYVDLVAKLLAALRKHPEALADVRRALSITEEELHYE